MTRGPFSPFHCHILNSGTHNFLHGFRVETKNSVFCLSPIWVTFCVQCLHHLSKPQIWAGQSSLKSLSGFHSLQNKAGMPKHGEQALCGLALLTSLSSPPPYTPATWNNGQLPNWPCIPYLFGRAAPFSFSPLICSACCLYSANSVLKDFDPWRSHSHILKDVRQNTSSFTFWSMQLSNYSQKSLLRPTLTESWKMQFSPV